MATRLNGQVGVGCVVTNHHGQILLGHRIKAGEYPTWCLPGGHLECGESFEDAAIREATEETGIAAFDDVRIFGICTHISADTVNLTAAVFARTKENNPKAVVVEPNVFGEWIWFDRTEIPPNLFQASAAVLALYRQMSVPDGWIVYSSRLFDTGALHRTKLDPVPKS